MDISKYAHRHVHIVSDGLDRANCAGVSTRKLPVRTSRHLPVIATLLHLSPDDHPPLSLRAAPQRLANGPAPAAPITSPLAAHLRVSIRPSPGPILRRPSSRQILVPRPPRLHPRTVATAIPMAPTQTPIPNLDEVVLSMKRDGPTAIPMRPPRPPIIPLNHIMPPSSIILTNVLEHNPLLWGTQAILPTPPRTPATTHQIP